MRKSSNPALGEKTFDRLASGYAGAWQMTINGTINKTLVLMVTLIWLYIEFLRLLTKLRQ